MNWWINKRILVNELTNESINLNNTINLFIDDYNWLSLIPKLLLVSFF